MKEIQSERSISTFLKDFFTVKNCKYIKLNPAMHTGLPDRLVLTSGGSAIFIELKSIGKSLRPMQEHWGDILNNTGHLYLVIDRINDEVVELLRQYLEAVDSRFDNQYQKKRITEIQQQIKNICRD